MPQLTLTIVSLFFALVANSFASPPAKPFATFEAAKKAARDGIYAGHELDFIAAARSLRT